MQEAEKRGLGRVARLQGADGARAPEHPDPRAASHDFEKKNPVTDAEIQAEYDKFKAQSSGTEYRARHILVEKEDDAKALIAQIKAGAKFEDLAKKNSKDPGSGANGGDLDFASAERLRARVLAGDGQAEEGRDDRGAGEDPVRLPHHPARRHARSAVPAARRSQAADHSSAWSSRRLPTFRDELRAKAKTDYKFTN